MDLGVQEGRLLIQKTERWGHMGGSSEGQRISENLEGLKDSILQVQELSIRKTSRCTRRLLWLSRELVTQASVQKGDESRTGCGG